MSRRAPTPIRSWSRCHTDRHGRPFVRRSNLPVKALIDRSESNFEAFVATELNPPDQRSEHDPSSHASGLLSISAAAAQAVSRTPQARKPRMRRQQSKPKMYERISNLEAQSQHFPYGFGAMATATVLSCGRNVPDPGALQLRLMIPMRNRRSASLLPQRTSGNLRTPLLPRYKAPSNGRPGW
jgi:hypothetical protein